MNLIGIDLHTDSFYVVRTRSTEGGQIRTERKYDLKGPGWDAFTKTLTNDDYVLVEATTNAFWFHDRIRPYVKECVILNVNRVAFSGNKTDKIDARRLLDLLSYYVRVKGVDELPSVYVPRPEVCRLRSLLSTYRLNKKIETQLKNRIHSLFKQNGVATTKKKLFTKAGWESAMKDVSRELRVHISLISRQLADAQRARRAVSDLIVDLGMSIFPEQIELLLSIPGFSVFTAIVLLADIDTIDRFPSAKRFTSYLRTAPRIKASNHTARLGAVSKQSRSLTCTILTQSIVHLKHAGPYLSSFYERVHVGKSTGKSRIALIRKTLVAAYYMLKRGTTFRWVDADRYERKKAATRLEVEQAMQRHRTEVLSLEEVAQYA